jgi:23S rRNA pseudouridine1911/1915/1917 synthase
VSESQINSSGDSQNPPQPVRQSPLELIIAGRHQGCRLDAVLTELCPDFSRSKIAKSIKTGLVSLDALTPKPSTIVKTGQKLIFRFPECEDNSLSAPEDLPIEIIYQDSDVIVINKPAGLTVHPGAGHTGPTLAGALLAMDPDLSQVGPPQRPGIVHRLDKDTSGVMIIARSTPVLDFLSDAFKQRQVEKLYLAFVRGDIPKTGRIDSPIGRHPTLRHKMRAGFPTDRPAVSLFRVIRRFPKTGISLVSITLLTGRTHQARVHLASIGAPVLADPVYGRALGPLTKNNPSLSPKLTRQFLHARRLSLSLPNGTKMAFRAPWPLDFRYLLLELLRLEKE